MSDLISPRRRSNPLFVSALVLVTLTLAPSNAQLPENVAVVGTVAHQFAPGTSGLHIVSLAGGASTPLAPLPKALTVSRGGIGGCYSVLYRSYDGTLFVGDAAGPGGKYYVHILKVAGNIVLKSTSVLVGQVPNRLGNTRKVGGMALLPDGRVVVSFDPAIAAVTGRTPSIAILNTKPPTPTLTPVLITPLVEPFLYGIAVSPDGRTAYVTSQASSTKNPPFFPAKLYAVDLTKTTPVTPVLLHTWSKRMVPKLTSDREGVLYATAGDPVSRKNAVPVTIEEIRITGSTVVVKSTSISKNVMLVGPALEHATGRFVFVSALSPSTGDNNSVWTSDRNGKLVKLAGPPSGGWGMPFAVDINNAFESYGETKGSDRHWFQECPNPGGLPQVGNLAFSLTLRSKAAPSNSFLVIGLAKSKLAFLGITVLAQTDIVLPVPVSTSSTVSLPIPNQVSLQDVQVFAQGVHVEAGGGWAASRGLDLVIQKK